MPSTPAPPPPDDDDRPSAPLRWHEVGTGSSAIGLDGNLAAALGYPIAIIAIISLIMGKDNRFVKFHALQSILLHVAFIIVAIALWIISFFLVIAGVAASSASNTGEIGSLLSMLIGLIWIVVIAAYIGAIIFAAIRAYQGNGFVLPMVGAMAQRLAGN